MAYVATRGGEKAIEQAERLFREELGTIDMARVAAIRASKPRYPVSVANRVWIGRPSNSTMS